MISIKINNKYDLSKLELIGKGTQGKVYRIDSIRCIKVFKKKAECQGEVSALKLAQGNRHFPKIYEYGEKYIVREYIKGIPLDKYLANSPLTPELSGKIIDLYDAMKKVGYLRWDTALFHIFINDEGMLKIIDPAKSLMIKAVYPTRLLRGLYKLGYKRKFLSHVKVMRPKLYKLWSTVKK